MRHILMSSFSSLAARHAVSWRTVASAALCASLCAFLVSVARADRYLDCEQGRDLEVTVRGCSDIISRGKRETRDKIVHALRQRGWAYGQQGKHDLAIADLDRALAMAPRDRFALVDRAEVRLRKGDIERAIADYSAAIAIAPREHESYGKRGSAYMRLKQYDAAIADFNKAMSVEPGEAPTYLSDRGEAYLKKGDLDLAITDFSRAIGMKPDTAEAYIRRADAYTEKGDVEAARDDLRSYIKILDQDIRRMPAYKQFYAARGWAHLRLASYDAAIADFTAAIYGPDDAHGYLQRAYGYHAKGDLDRAVADYAKAAQLLPREGGAWAHLGRARFDAGDFKSAAADLLRFIELKGPQELAGADLIGHVEALIYRFLARARTGEADAAAAELDAAAAKLRTRDWPYAVVELLLGRRSAQAVMEMATSADDRCEAHLYVGEWRLLQGDKAAALRDLKTAVETCRWDHLSRWSARAELARLGG